MRRGSGLWCAFSDSFLERKGHCLSTCCWSLTLDLYPPDLMEVNVSWASALTPILAGTGGGGIPRGTLSLPHSKRAGAPSHHRAPSAAQPFCWLWVPETGLLPPGPRVPCSIQQSPFILPTAGTSALLVKITLIAGWKRPTRLASWSKMSPRGWRRP